jgi:hypothetical protein
MSKENIMTINTYAVGMTTYGPYNDGRLIHDVIHLVDGKVFLEEACSVHCKEDGSLYPIKPPRLDELEIIEHSRFTSLSQLQGWGVMKSLISQPLRPLTGKR